MYTYTYVCIYIYTYVYRTQQKARLHQYHLRCSGCFGNCKTRRNRNQRENYWGVLDGIPRTRWRNRISVTFVICCLTLLRKVILCLSRSLSLSLCICMYVCIHMYVCGCVCLTRMNKMWDSTDTLE